MTARSPFGRVWQSASSPRKCSRVPANARTRERGNARTRENGWRRLQLQTRCPRPTPKTPMGYHQTDPYDRGSALSRSFLPLALITLGVVFLLGNLVPERGRAGLFVVGLGAAFLVGRLTTGRYGYAVPAGILMAIGAYISLQDLSGFRALPGARGFFLPLRLRVGLTLALGPRP